MLGNAHGHDQSAILLCLPWACTEGTLFYTEGRKYGTSGYIQKVASDDL